MVYTCTFTELHDSLIGPEDCSDIRAMGFSTSGVYRVYPGSLAKRIQADVYCDMTTTGGNWLVGIMGKPAFRCVNNFLMMSVATQILLHLILPRSCLWILQHALFASIPLPMRIWSVINPAPMTMCFFIYPASTVAIQWFHQSSFCFHDWLSWNDFGQSSTKTISHFEQFKQWQLLMYCREQASYHIARFLITFRFSKDVKMDP